MAEVDTQIHKVLDLRLNPNPQVGPAPLRRGVTSARVSTLGPISAAFAILSFHYTRDLVQGLGGSRGESQDANSLEDVAEREVRRAFDEEKWAWRERERERERSVCHWSGGEEAGVETPP
jgi:transposase